MCTFDSRFLTLLRSIFCSFTSFDTRIPNLKPTLPLAADIQPKLFSYDQLIEQTDKRLDFPLICSHCLSYTINHSHNLLAMSLVDQIDRPMTKLTKIEHVCREKFQRLAARQLNTACFLPVSCLKRLERKRLGHMQACRIVLTPSYERPIGSGSVNASASSRASPCPVCHQLS